MISRSLRRVHAIVLLQQSKFSSCKGGEFESEAESRRGESAPPSKPHQTRVPSQTTDAEAPTAVHQTVRCLEGDFASSLQTGTTQKPEYSSSISHCTAKTIYRTYLNVGQEPPDPSSGCRCHGRINMV